MSTAGDYRTNFIYLYGFVYSGIAALLLLILDKPLHYGNYSDKAALVLGIIGCLALLINGQIKVTPITIFILCYIFIRALIVSSFATMHSYSVFNYLLPLKNWLALLLFFVIGQSLDLPRERVNDLILKIFIATSGFIFLFQLYCLVFDGNFETFSISRIPLLKYRVGMDIILIIYALIVSTQRYLDNLISRNYYLILVAVVMFNFISSQTKQLALSIIIVLLYFAFSRGRAAMKRKGILLVSFVAVVSCLLLFASLILRDPINDSYFSFLKRVELIEYIKDKVEQYPLVGYSIPSNISNGEIPTDIRNNFFVGEQAEKIYPADLPFLAVILEEGILGVIFILVLLYWSYKTNTDVKILFLLICATFLTFRMYYMVTLGSTLIYFLLGFYTRGSSSGQLS